MFNDQAGIKPWILFTNQRLWIIRKKIKRYSLLRELHALKDSLKDGLSRPLRGELLTGGR
jgi:hypothetical protein